MNLYRSLLCWLSRKEIRAEVMWERARCMAGVKFACEVAYLRGHHDGETEALSRMAAVILERGGTSGLIGIDDLENVKKELTH